MMSDAGRLDEKLLALLDEALERIGPERTARRAALLSAKSAEMYWVDNDLSRVNSPGRRGDRDRPGGQRPASLAAALHRKIFIPPARTRRASDSRLADEMLELGQATGDREAVLRAHAYRLWSFLELGDIAGGRSRAGGLRAAGRRAADARAQLA